MRLLYPPLTYYQANFFEIELFSGHVKYFSYLGARYNKKANDFLWDDGTEFSFNQFRKIMPDHPNSCLAIFPQKIEGNRSTWNWHDVKCDVPKAYFICSYTNGNLCFFTLLIEILANKQGRMLQIE